MTRSAPSPESRYRPVPTASASPVGLGLRVMPLRVEEQHVLIVVGEADLDTADQLRDQLTDALAGRPPALRVELRSLDFCDLSGLDALHDAARTAARAGVYLTFSGVSAQLAWMHRTFPASDSPPTHPDPAAAAPRTWAGEPTSTRPSALSPPAEPADAIVPLRGSPGSPASPSLTATPSGEDHGVGTAPEWAAAARRGRQGAKSVGAQADAGELLHAVPLGDATRSAVCGARVSGVRALWDPWDQRQRCPGCIRRVTSRQARDDQFDTSPRRATR